MKKTLKPTKEFVRLFNEAEKVRKLIPEFLSGLTGYNTSWCEKNITNCLKNITKQQRTEVGYMMLRAQVIKKKLWSDFYYKEFYIVKDVLSSQMGKIFYNPKTKLVEINDGSKLQKELNGLVHKFKNKLAEFSNKAQKYNDTSS